MATAERVERRMMLVDVGVEMRNVDVLVGQRNGKV
jgi:septum formation inhibitor-activating ATPase MinD